jgi:retron-type reverse transcriptase
MWTSNMENGLLNGIVLLDLRKAFDLVDTDILLKKLSVYQCDKNSIAWLKSYLQNRHQCVQFKGKISDTKPVTHGVPRGIYLALCSS